MGISHLQNCDTCAPVPIPTLTRFFKGRPHYWQLITLPQATRTTKMYTFAESMRQPVQGLLNHTERMRMAAGRQINHLLSSMPGVALRSACETA
jgi:hypothetical protein